MSVLRKMHILQGQVSTAGAARAHVCSWSFYMWQKKRSANWIFSETPYFLRVLSEKQLSCMIYISVTGHTVQVYLMDTKVGVRVEVVVS